MTVEVVDEVVMIDIKDILSDPDFNCRGEIIPFDTINLAKNIKANGLMQPIIVQPFDRLINFKYRVIVGHRRLAATKQLRETQIKALVKHGLTDEQAHILNIVENVEREDLNILQEAKAILRFKLAGYSQKEVAEKINVSTGWVQTRYALLELPIEIQNEAAAGFLTTEHIKQLKDMPRETQYAHVRAIKDAKLKGDKYRIKDPDKIKKKNPHQKKIRSPVEIEEMQDLIRDGIGNGAFTRALGWASGWVTTLELLQDVKNQAEELGVPWSIPAEIIANV